MYTIIFEKYKIKNKSIFSNIFEFINNTDLDILLM